MKKYNSQYDVLYDSRGNVCYYEIVCRICGHKIQIPSRWLLYFSINEIYSKAFCDKCHTDYYLLFGEAGKGVDYLYAQEQVNECFIKIIKKFDKSNFI